MTQVANSFRYQYKKLAKSNRQAKQLATATTHKQRRKRKRIEATIKAINMNLPKRNRKFVKHDSKKFDGAPKLSIRELADLLYEK